MDFAGLVKRDRGPAIYKPVHRDWNVINEPGLKNQEGRGSDGCPLCAKRVGSFTYDFFKKSRLLSFQFKTITSLFKTTILLYHHLILTSFIKHDPQFIPGKHDAQFIPGKHDPQFIPGNANRLSSVV